MRDCFDILITKYYQALNGNITYNSTSVPVYDRVPKSTSYPYIKFGTYTGVDDSNKSNYMKEVTVIVQVVTGFDIDYGGKAPSDNIADQVIDIIRERPANLLDLSPNFNMINVTVDDTTVFEELTETHLIIYRNIRFRHKVEQLTSLNSTTPLCATPRPTALTATAASSTQINLAWIDNSGGVASFSIERSTTYSGGFSEIATVNSGVTTYNNTSLTSGDVYFFRIRALDGCYSTYSDIAFESTQSGGSCADATAVLKDTAGSVLKTEAIPSGVSEDIQILDGNCEVFNSLTDMVAQGNILAEGYLSLSVPDGLVRIRKSDNSIITTQSAPSGGLVFYNVADSPITVNSNSFGNALAETTFDVPVQNSENTALGSNDSGVWRIANITLTQPNGSGESKVAGINISCTQINALSNNDLISQLANGQVTAIVEGRLTSTAVNPNAHLLHSSVIPASVVTGDWRDQYNAGYLAHPTLTSLSRLYMLADGLNLRSETKNPFGHTKRYTGRTGSYYNEVENNFKDKNGGSVANHGAAFPDGIIYDHYTGRAWNFDLDLYSGINFATHVSNAAAVATHGITWRVPTLEEFMNSVAVSITMQGTRASGTYTTTTNNIFSHVAADTIQWTANVNPNTTANNYCVRQTTTSSLIVSDARTATSARGGTIVANFNTSDLIL